MEEINMAMKNFNPKPKSDFIGNVEHRGGKKLSQQGTEFSHKIKKTRKHPSGGYRGRKG